MTPKDMLTNRAFCPIPWTGFYVDTSGDVKNCICSYESIGNLKNNSIQEIVHGEKNTKIKQQILNKEKPSTCDYCYELEQDKKSFDVVSSRVYYLKELRGVDKSIYDNPKNFDLHQIDVRWSNICNHACVYCGPVLSSKWADELGQVIYQPSQQRQQELKNYIFSNISQLKNVYLAGGEPLLMKENEEFLEELFKQNPEVMLRVNTNLSKTNTRVLDLICQFKNVHWTVSIESTFDKFEYMRFGAQWEVFLENLDKIKKLPHKITFNMVWCILNYDNILDCVDYFLGKGFGPNAFILTAINQPGYLDTRHLPNEVLQSIEHTLQDRINSNPGFLLEDGYQNLLEHIRKPFKQDLVSSFKQLAELDRRRGVDSSKIFTELYKLKEGN